MNRNDRYFEVLGLTPSATPEAIKQAWRDLALVWHPDRFPANSRVRKKAEEKLYEINEAYRILSEAIRSSPASPQTAAPEKDPAGTKTQSSQAGTAPPPYFRPTFRSRPGGTPFLQPMVWVAVTVIAAFFGVSYVYRWVWGSMSQAQSILGRAGGRPEAPVPPELPTADQLVSRAGQEAERLWAPRGRVTSVPVDVPAPAAASADPGSVTRTAGRRQPGVRASGKGSVSLIRSRIPPGAGTLRIVNRTPVDAVATVSSENSPSDGLAMVWVGAQQEAVIPAIGPGSYFVTFMAGEQWEPKSRRFIGRQVTSGRAGPFRFVQVQGEEGLRSDTFEVVLTPR